MRAAARLAPLLAAVLSACSANTAHIAPAEPWPMYQRTADRNAVLPPQPIADSWVFDTGAQINGGMSLSGNALFVDTLGGDLFAIDARAQQVAWHVRMPHALMTTPVLSDGMVFVGSGTADVRPRLRATWGEQRMVMGVAGGDAVYAYDARSGKLRWSYATEGQDMPSAAIVGRALIFANGDFHAYALDTQTGRLLWKRQLAGLATMSSAAENGGRVFFSICDYRFPYHCETDALEAASGKILWRAPYGDADASPAFASGTVFVSGLDYARGERSWPLVQQAFAVVAALDASSGKPKWVYRDSNPGLPSNVGTAERAVAGTYAAGKYFQALPGRSALLAFDARTGAVLWTFHALAPIKMSPLYERGKLYAGDNAGVFYVLDAGNGSIDRLRAFRQPFSSAPPILAGSTILLAQGRSVWSLRVQELYRGPRPQRARKAQGSVRGGGKEGAS